MADHDRDNSNYQRGRGDGFFQFLVTFACVGVCFGIVFKKCGDDSRIEWFRKHTVQTGDYVPCKDSGFDWAMDVDCSAWRELQRERKNPNQPQ